MVISKTFTAIFRICSEKPTGETYHPICKKRQYSNLHDHPEGRKIILLPNEMAGRSMNNKQLPGPKLTLWIFSLLPFILLGSGMFYGSNILGVLVYASLVLFWGYFLFYQLKIKKQKIWVALLQTAGVIILFIALLAVFLFLWTVNIGVPMDGVH